MKTWQILAIGIAVLVLFLFFPIYESLIAGTGAVLVVATVVVGFMLRPRRDVFYVDTKFHVHEPDEILGIEHDLLALKLEVARLWLLFIPTFLAFAFLVVTAAKGTTWKFSLLQTFLSTSQYGGYLFLMSGRVVLLIVVGCLSTWIQERWALRNANATNARSAVVKDGRISYIFLNETGEYYGGEAYPFGATTPPALGRLVLYDCRKADLNKIVVGLLFHRLVIIGRGLADLEHDTVQTRVEARLMET